MPRKPRFAPPDYPLHITQRGSYRQPVFFTEEDRRRFLTLRDEHADQRLVSIHGYALLSNHLHLVVTCRQDGGVSNVMQNVTGQYAQYVHGRLNRRGRLWQSRFYSCVLDASHVLTPLAYVDLNPVRARTVDRAIDSPWSSAAAHFGLAPTVPDWLEMETLHRHFRPKEWQERLQQPPPRNDIAALRHATRAECPLSAPGFIDELESKFQVRLRPLPPGPPPKKPSQAHDAAIAVSSSGGIQHAGT